MSIIELEQEIRRLSTELNSIKLNCKCVPMYKEDIINKIVEVNDSIKNHNNECYVNLTNRIAKLEMFFSLPFMVVKYVSYFIVLIFMFYMLSYL